MTNETIASQLAHRTIRAYKDQPLTDAEVETLMDVARHTATSSFLQSCTVLHITDPQVREAIGAASGQPYVGGTKGDLFIFVADLYRNSRIRAEQGVSSEALGSINLFLTALEDALLAAQNVVVAAESMGLGTVYLGSILADPRATVKALELPELTFPGVGLLVGHADQEPGQKPRMPRSVTTAKNTYPRVDVDALTSAYERLERTSTPTQREAVPPLPPPPTPKEDSAIVRDAQALANASVDNALHRVRTVLDAAGMPLTSSRPRGARSGIPRDVLGGQPRAFKPAAISTDEAQRRAAEAAQRAQHKDTGPSR